MFPLWGGLEHHQFGAKSKRVPLRGDVRGNTSACFCFGGDPKNGWFPLVELSFLRVPFLGLVQAEAERKPLSGPLKKDTAIQKALLAETCLARPEVNALFPMLAFAPRLKCVDHRS